MAERRMFTKKVTDDDNFMSLSASAQALYLHLSMSADDDGFCNQVSISMFKAHASISDLQQLLEKRYIYQFDSGVIVIKHWRMANALRKDRYTQTNFKEELAKLRIKENGSYTMLKPNEREWLPDGCQMVATCQPQDSIGKDSIGKDSIDKSSIDKSSIEKVEDRESIDNRGYGGKKERERKEPNETSCPQYSSPSYPQSQQLTANDIVDLFNDICTTYPTVDGITQYSTALSNSLMFDRYSKADYSTIFQKAEQSSNLKARTHDEESPVDFGWILEHSKEIKDGAFDN